MPSLLIKGALSVLLENTRETNGLVLELFRRSFVMQRGAFSLGTTRCAPKIA